MKILKTLLTVFVFGFVVTSYAKADTIDQPFTTTNVQEALDMARAQGKLVFLDFTAKWCTPCRYMERTTFKDNRVVSKLQDKYIAVKVDIDKGNGADIKRQFDVKYLPTMLIVDANGLTLKKIEEQVSAEQLMPILQTYENTSTGNSSYRKTIKTSTETDEFSISREDYLNYSRMEEKRSNYRVQLGVYSDFAAASQKSKELKEIFMEPIIILQDDKNGQIMYKVLMGNFGSLSEAESFSQILRRDFGMESIIK